MLRRWDNATRNRFRGVALVAVAALLAACGESARHDAEVTSGGGAQGNGGAKGNGGAVAATTTQGIVGGSQGIAASSSAGFGGVPNERQRDVTLQAVSLGEPLGHFAVTGRVTTRDMSSLVP